jgi:hypothetical protein
MEVIYGWHYDGVFVNLGEYVDIADAMEKHPTDIVWYLDKEGLLELIKSADIVLSIEALLQNNQKKGSHICRNFNELNPSKGIALHKKEKI